MYEISRGIYPKRFVGSHQQKILIGFAVAAQAQMAGRRIRLAARFFAAEESLRQRLQAGRAEASGGARRAAIEEPHKFQSCLIFDFPVRAGEYV